MLIFLGRRRQIVGLQTGQAIIFAPSGLGVKTVDTFPGAWDDDNDSATLFQNGYGAVTPFGQGYLLVRSRQRITLDGGQSLLAVPNVIASGSNNTIETHAAVIAMIEGEYSGMQDGEDDGQDSVTSDSGFETCSEADEDVTMAVTRITGLAPSGPVRSAESQGMSTIIYLLTQA